MFSTILKYNVINIKRILQVTTQTSLISVRVEILHRVPWEIFPEIRNDDVDYISNILAPLLLVIVFKNINYKMKLSITKSLSLLFEVFESMQDTFYPCKLCRLHCIYRK